VGSGGARITFLLVLCGAMLHTTPSAADDARPPSVTVSLLDTLMVPGDYDVSVAETSLKAGLAAGLAVSVDVLMLSPLELGAQALVLQRDSDDPQLAHSTLVHVGGHAGAAFVLREGVVLGAAALIGMDSLDFRDAETLTTGLGLGLAGHADVRLYRWVWLRGQVGALWQPFGGQAASDVTMPPTPFFGLGLALGVPATPD